MPATTSTPQLPKKPKGLKMVKPKPIINAEVNKVETPQMPKAQKNKPATREQPAAKR